MKRSEKLEAQICLQCGSMSWTIFSKCYMGKYRVRKDGHIVFNEEFDEIEFVCNKCGSHYALLAVKGTATTFSGLAQLNPMERILQALNWVADGTLELTDDVSPEDVWEMVECFKEKWEMLHKSGRSRAVEEFLSRAKEVVGKWKILEGS